MITTLQQLFEEVLRHTMPTLTAATPFAELPGWDSVAHLALLLAVERHFSATFTSAQMVSMKTVGDMITVLEGTNG
jgi:acyl carrier protein